MEERKSHPEAPSLMGLGEAEFESAYREYRNLVLYILASILHDKEDIEDACQETFLSFRSAGKVDSPKAFLSKVARSKAFDILRKRKDEETLDENEAAKDDSPRSAEFDQWARSIVGDEDYSLILLHLIDGYSFASLSKRFGVKEASLRSRYSRALKKLRREGK